LSIKPETLGILPVLTTTRSLLRKRFYILFVARG